MSKAKTKTTATNEAKQMTASEPLLVKAPEAAKMLNLSKSKLWSLTTGRKIPFVRIGKAVRFSPEDLRAWIEQQKIPAIAC